jgi:hypothetical protein
MPISKFKEILQSNFNELFTRKYIAKTFTAEFSKDTNATSMFTSFLQEINIYKIMNRADYP